MSSVSENELIKQIIDTVTERILTQLKLSEALKQSAAEDAADATTQSVAQSAAAETSKTQRKAAKRVVKVNNVPTNQEINAVRKDRDALRSQSKRSASDERELEKIEAQLFAMRRAYHAHNKARREEKQKAS